MKCLTSMSAYRPKAARGILRMVTLLLLPCLLMMFAPPGGVAAEAVTIPTSSAVTAESGVPVVIYGQRHRDCKSKEPPSFEWVVANAVTRPPSNGELSDGGIGQRQSSRCGGRVPVRAISYTSEPSFVGTDGVVFWDREGIVITVVPR